MIDVLAIGAHPDDLELGCAGTLLKLKGLGYGVGMVDLTRGERGTRGSADIRRVEAASSLKVLGLDFRETLDLGDMQLQDTPDRRRAVVEVIRKHRPRLVLTHWQNDRHPDHEGAAALVTHAMFFAGARKFDATGEPHTPDRLLYFPSHWVEDLNVYVDITESFQQKFEAIRLKANPIITPEMLPSGDGEDINGPSMIKVPDWIKSPLGKYYLY